MFDRINHTSFLHVRGCVNVNTRHMKNVHFYTLQKSDERACLHVTKVSCAIQIQTYRYTYLNSHFLFLDLV